MVREDIVGGLKNAIERGESVQEAKNSFLFAGYLQKDVEEAAASLEKVNVQTRKTDMPIPELFTASLEQPEVKAGQPGAEETKPLPQIKVKRTFNYLLLIPIVIISAVIAYLIYSILLS